MAISEYTGRQRPEKWMVLQDGRPIVRGQEKAAAERVAEQLGRDLARKRAGSRIHAPYIEIAYDREAMKRVDDLYTEFRGYRNGD